MGALSGKTVVVTRASEQARELCSLLAAEGAGVHEVPTLVIVPLRGAELDPLDRALGALARGDYRAMLVTSANAVAVVADRLQETGLWARAREAVIFAIGPATARALVARGFAAPTVADEAVGEGLVRKLGEVLGAALAGQRLLLPRAREGREAIVEQLRAAGAELDVVPVYETVPVTDGPAPPSGAVDWVTFASPSSVKAFVARFGRPLGKVACIGPVTAQAAAALGVAVAALAREHTAAGLVQAMVEVERGG